MTFLEYAEKVSPVLLSDWQKRVFEEYEQAERENRQLFVCFPPRAGRGMTLKIIEKWKAERK